MKRNTPFVIAGAHIRRQPGGIYLLTMGLDLVPIPLIRTTANPDNAYMAILFERDCGATTGFSTQISVLPVSRHIA